jgi:hypothetical protein
MKQKYAIIRDDDQGTIIIREYAELDKEMMSLLCEETYAQDVIKEACQAGHQAVIDAIRTNNMYPPTVYAEPIAEGVEGLFREGGNLSAELFFDDKDLFIKEVEPVVEATEEEIEKDVEVDDLLEDGIDEEYSGGEEVLKDLKTSIQVADDDTNTTEEST